MNSINDFETNPKMGYHVVRQDGIPPIRPSQDSSEINDLIQYPIEERTRAMHSKSSMSKVPNVSTSETNDTRLAQWKIHPGSPFWMLAFFICGIASAIGHDQYYRALANTPAGDDRKQQWAIRFGTALAFLTKSFLGAAVGIAFTQSLWSRMRGKAVSVTGLDAMFSLTSDPTSFFHVEVLFGASLLAVIAVIAWLIPLIATITPGTLSVRTEMTTNWTTSMVPSLEKLGEANATENRGAVWGGIEGAGRLEGVAPPLARLLSVTASSMAIIPHQGPFPNCTYNLQFYGPSLKCQNLSSVKTDPDERISSRYKQLGQTWDTYIDKEVGGTLDVTYMGHTSLPAGSFLVYTGPVEVSKNLTCNLWNSSYEARVSYREGIQDTELEKITHINPVSYESSFYHELPLGAIAYQSVFNAMATFLSTTVGTGSTMSMVGSDSAFMASGLAACPEIKNSTSTGAYQYSSSFLENWMCRGGSIERGIEDLSQNLTLSLLSSSHHSNLSSIDVRVKYPENLYTYNYSSLVIAYAIGVGVTLLCMLIGVYSYHANGYSARTSFSSIMLTTRNSELDALGKGHCLGSNPLHRDIGKAKLRYGVVEDSAGSTAHVAFGMESTTGPLKKGEQCY